MVILPYTIMIIQDFPGINNPKIVGIGTTINDTMVDSDRLPI